MLMQKTDCNMPDKRLPDPLEQEILSQIKDIDRKLASLAEERRVLERLLIKARRPEVRDVTRKNSIERVVIESRILELLQASKSPVSAVIILKELRRLQPGLKDTTFRSYLHRLKEKGLSLIHISEPTRPY